MNKNLKTLKILYQFRREYLREELSEKNVFKDPFEQFENWFKQALKIEKFDPHAMVLSTSNKKNKVSSRVVLLKEYSQKGFLFFGNYESKKGADLNDNPNASILFYWPKMTRQIRIEGMVKKVYPEVSDEYFKTRPRGSRIAAMISPQSRGIRDRIFLEEEFKRVSSEMRNREIQRPKNWGGWILKPEKLELWQGRANRLHDRIEYLLKDKKWIIRRLAP